MRIITEVLSSLLEIMFSFGFRNVRPILWLPLFVSFLSMTRSLACEVDDSSGLKGQANDSPLLDSLDNQAGGHQFLSLKDCEFIRANRIKADLLILDSINPNDHDENIRYLIDEMTTELIKDYDDRLLYLHSDSTIHIIEELEHCYFLSELDTSCNLLYLTIHDFWFDFIVNRLKLYSATDDSIRDRFEFQYIVARCKENEFLVSYQPSAYSKIIKYLNEFRVSYLIWRIYTSSTLLTKALLLLLILTSSIGVFCVVKKIFKL